MVRHFLALATCRDTAEFDVTGLMSQLVDLFPEGTVAAVDEATGHTALHHAARYGSAQRGVWLVSKGASVTAVNKVITQEVSLL